MHTFKFIQEGDTALGCTVLLDDRPLMCEEFELDAKVGEITYLTAKIALSEVDINIDGKILKINRIATEQNTLSDTKITFK